MAEECCILILNGKANPNSTLPILCMVSKRRVVTKSQGNKNCHSIQQTDTSNWIILQLGVDEEDDEDNGVDGNCENWRNKV